MPSVETLGGEEFVSLCKEGISVDLPDSFSDMNKMGSLVASLDIADYLQCDADCCFETVFLSIQSNNFCNPNAAGYNMKIPPANYKEAMMRSDADEWKRVIDKELSDLKTMGVYEEVDLLEDTRTVGKCWVLEFKIPDDGRALIYKARLVTQGFSQVPYIDYYATFAPVAKPASICYIAMHSTVNRWELKCFDTTRAFLWGDLTCKIYMQLPHGYTKTSGNCWLLKKSLYGIKQVSLIWYQLLRKALEALGFLHLEFDHVVFIFNRLWAGNMVHCLLGMHVNDGMGGCNSSQFMRFIKGKIKKAFGIKDLGPMKCFLGASYI